MRRSVECGTRNAEGKTAQRGSADTAPHSALRTPHSPGFTLLEVMAAVAILSLVLVTLLGLKNRSMQHTMRAEHMTIATLLADRVMVETLFPRPVVGEDEGRFEEEAFKEYLWKKIISPTPLPGIIEVRVAVLWKEGERDELVELVSYE